MKKILLLITSLILPFGCSDDDPSRIREAGGDMNPGILVPDTQNPDASPDLSLIHI